MAIATIFVLEKGNGYSHCVNFESVDDAIKSLAAGEVYWEKSAFRAVKIIGKGKIIIVSTDVIASVTLIYKLEDTEKESVNSHTPLIGTRIPAPNKTSRNGILKNPVKKYGNPDASDTRHNVAVALAKKPAVPDGLKYGVMLGITRKEVNSKGGNLPAALKKTKEIVGKNILNKRTAKPRAKRT